MLQSTDVTCPTCKANGVMRVSRNGFLQRNVLSHFGIYPWKCGACGSTFLCRRRGQRSRADGRESESSGATPSQRQA